MNRGNFELGVQRLYYVAWAIWTTSWCIGAIIHVIDDMSIYPGDVMIWLFGAIVLPPLIMFAVRWIYRGFFPKADAA